MQLTRSFYEQNNVEVLAKKLLGKKLVTNFNGAVTAGIITEVEAYSGRNDKACHANNGLRTLRTEVMYGAGGYAYVYLCYGIHHMINIVTNVEGQADAVLIRAIEPIIGIDTMLERRGFDKLTKALTSGPGNVGKALGLNTKRHNGLSLLENEIWIEDQAEVSEEQIISTTRIGVDYAEEDALKPWRFYIKDSKWVSKK
ncbi:DNA-3-methyladenine glycosylase [Roseivirga ehrenbergii]|uniref:Putative 3-methyladenine DNA glycosylase n=1 Tax=Roseivirga ehrenbergii (strain DSM 102268 / JCM 13514 / KCTC 12282 / NCIMB 14502 / KMM 6017) TaxID=279360 RepID=A0A150X8D7_ROSEK|nr:DNA-3-methyladenine glycosylase [Roseivirga ehrenbergii]KYG74995.1 3-methyladenine DNA glycosylase [Roseivirga ehrenbergii]TCL13654.1 DNA-3-methyladenine glycosylase [Roseivirga ehrenbergii]